MEYIERGAVLRKLICLSGIECENTLQRAAETVRDFPAADVKPVVHANWIEKHTNVGTTNTDYFCSNCNFAAWHIKTNYCPNCGSYMREGC